MAGGTISAQALSVVQYAQQSNSPLIREIGYSMLENGSALTDIPLDTQPTLVRRGSRYIDNLPNVNYTPLNTPPVVVLGQATPWAEQVYQVNNQFQIDEFYLMDENSVGNPLEVQVNSWIKHAFVFDFNLKFINNTHNTVNAPSNSAYSISDPNAIVGLKARLDNPITYGVNQEMKINGNLVMTSALSQSDAEAVIYTVQESLDYIGCTDGQDCLLYCNDIFKRRFEQCIRTLGAGAGFDIMKDSFDRPVSSYKSMKIRDLGRVAPSLGGVQTQRIISATENADGTDTGNNSYTSFYIVRYGSQYFSGWQMRPLKPKNLGLDPTNGTVYNVVIKWAMGIWQQDTRAISRVYNIQLA
jgi:hypothetical protein